MLFIFNSARGSYPMKKLISVILVLMLMLSLFSAAFAADEDIGGSLMIYTSMYDFEVSRIKAALKEEFPNLDVEFFANGTGNIQTKVAGEMESGRLSCDMLMVAEPAYSLELKDLGYLEPVGLENPEGLFRDGLEYDADGYWYPVRILNMVLAYNPEKHSLDTLPKTFRAFAEDPAMYRKISMSNPLSSDTAMAAVTALSGKYGYEYFDALGKNEVMVESGSSALAKLQSDECIEIMILEESVLRIREEDQSAIAVIYPEDGVILIPSTIMTVAESRSANQNIEACEAVTQWMLSEAGQKYILGGYMHSVLKGMEPPYDSIDTDTLAAMDMGVDWDRCYHSREEIRTRFQEAVTLSE